MTATVVKERGILFSDPMVRRIFDGSKTMTRRLVNPQPEITIRDIGEGCAEVIWKDPKRLTNAGGGTRNGGKDILETIAHKYSGRYGRPGDRVWVRETWCELDPDHWWDPTLGRAELVHPGRYPRRNAIAYRADGTDEDGERCRKELGYKWKSSMFMKRWMTRILLELTDVRVERLQEITEDDAKAEGARHFPDLMPRHPYGQTPGWSMETPTSTDQCLGTARMAFASYINKLHGGENWNLKPSNLWDENPWVWVLAFRRIES